MTIFEEYPTLNGLKNLITEDEARAFIDEKKFKKYKQNADKYIKRILLSELFPEELEQEQITLRNFMGCWGNISIEAVCKMLLIIKYFKPKKIFEIGTFNGLTTLQMAINSPDATKIYTLDLPNVPNIQTEHSLNWLDKIINRKRVLGEYFAEDPISCKITQILHDSATFDFSPFYNSINLVFIDAGHDYENVKTDTENAMKIITSNGIILWDNYSDILSPEVTHYLGEIATQLPIYHLKGTNMAVYWKRS